MTVGGDVHVAGAADYESARRSQIARFDGAGLAGVLRGDVIESVEAVFLVAALALLATREVPLASAPVLTPVPRGPERASGTTA